MSGRGFSVSEAGPEDDREIRALLRESVMDGLIRVALTREPNFLVGAKVEGERERTVLVRRSSPEPGARCGLLLGMGTRSVRSVFHRGEPARVGYLGQLRAAQPLRHLRPVKAAFRWFEKTVQADELPFDLTAIVTDNRPARRLLERGLPGLPSYRILAEIETLVLSTADPAWRRMAAGRVRPARQSDRPAIVRFLQAQLGRYALAPRWTEEDLTERCTDLLPEHFMLLEDGGALRAVGAVWDQRRFKQVVVDGYRPWLSFCRPALNPALALAGQPRLPPAGTALAMAYLSHFAVADDADGASAVTLVNALRRQARGRRISQLVLTLARTHPLTALLRRCFSARPYRSVVYAVGWPGRAPVDGAEVLDGRMLHVEAATL